MPKQIVRQAPYLRRYARALTGSQATGDRLVQQTMERLLAPQAVLPSDVSLRVAIYRALQQAWAGDAPTGDRGGLLDVDLRLQTLAPDQRAALLLTAMEGFTPAEAAQVLGLTLGLLSDRLDAAERALAQIMATDVVIIEDEPIIALDLTRLVRELGHRVVGTASTRAEAVDLARRSRPGLVLADVRLADGSSGMDAATEIAEIVGAPVIFITAFPEHLLSGDRPEPAFLITKPFREEAVRALIAQALFFNAAPSPPISAEA